MARGVKIDKDTEQALLDAFFKGNRPHGEYIQIEIEAKYHKILCAINSTIQGLEEGNLLKLFDDTDTDIFNWSLPPPRIT